MFKFQHLSLLLCFSTVVIIIIIIRLHYSTTYVDAACCYRPSNVVCQSVCYSSEPCKNDKS